MCVGDINGEPGCERAAVYAMAGAVVVSEEAAAIAIAQVCERHAPAMAEYLSWPGMPAMVMPVGKLHELRDICARDGEVFELQAAAV